MRRSINIFLQTAFLIMLSSFTFADEDHFVIPSKIQWEFSPEENLSISISDEFELQTVTYFWDGEEINIPTPDLENIGEVDLRAVDVYGMDKPGENSYRVIEIGFGGRYCSSVKTGCDNAVRYLVNQNGYESVSISSNNN